MNRGVFRTHQTSKIERFTKTFNGFWPLTIFEKLFIFDVLQGSEYISGKHFDCI